MKTYTSIPSAVKWWLFAGIVLIFFQVVIGGITRLTGSGLSITKWEIVTGTLPPMNDNDWNKEFDLYKETPQYKKINEGLSLSDFKFIYFWEYFHRLWARMMGFIFIIPFVFFFARGYFNPPLIRRLGIIFLLAATVAVFGWIMVASGLVERPWVNAYKLSMHLGLALITFGYLLWTYFLVQDANKPMINYNAKLHRLGVWLCIFIVIQIFTGALVSGMRAALVYPSWPDMNGVYLPAILLQAENWNAVNFSAYDGSAFMPALVQFIHRNSAYLIVIYVIYFLWKVLSHEKTTVVRNTAVVIGLIVAVQVTLGIITLILSKGQIPVLWGVAHQGVAILLLSAVLYFVFKYRQSRKYILKV